MTQAGSAVAVSTCSIVPRLMLGVVQPPVRRLELCRGSSRRDRFPLPGAGPCYQVARRRALSCGRQRAASMPTGASSTTRQCAGATPSSVAASRRISGCGFPCRASQPQTLALKTSSKLWPPSRWICCIGDHPRHPSFGTPNASKAARRRWSAACPPHWIIAVVKRHRSQALRARHAREGGRAEHRERRKCTPGQRPMMVMIRPASLAGGSDGSSRRWHQSRSRRSPELRSPSSPLALR